ncbi:fasciclin domain-containing protein [Cocleimonas sp. KMM 6892]|uniref:fasciclin domain-containing protein n=1 Tax=unclassified Cocleimonas TaxID=2639732 RepID=UPI002DBF1951|nr:MULTISPECIES: fasciclin domain-containing protein [unclassified Cocleimonas]MEB8432935.1 fasciclin domain-containing protein [Cocleimonas sp. KMM 6892]MEC4716084.1 fasciclin domain-containing protein [Cocleimonas sp. KMM 6895]MEC4745545.1 fasciclin domain-containing protein [Cocleimonas sp. KMM 6896]
MKINLKSGFKSKLNAKLLTAAIATLFVSMPMMASASDCDYSKKMKSAQSAQHSMQGQYSHSVNKSPMAQGGFIKVGAHSPKADIVDTAVKAGSFNTLVTAVKAAGLVDTLKGKGPFTVFAPTDEAFAKIPADVLNGLLADKEALRKVLLYHVVAGKVTADQVVKVKSAATVQGSDVMVDASNGVMINNAKVVKADIMTSNGVIHVIDTVLMPK